MVIFSQCIDCKNFIGENTEGKFICKAFPKEIPDKVFWNEVNHTKSIDGDNGYRYEDKYK